MFTTYCLLIKRNFTKLTSVIPFFFVQKMHSLPLLSKKKKEGNEKYSKIHFCLVSLELGVKYEFYSFGSYSNFGQ